MSEKKILAINPELFSFANNTTRKKREPKPANPIKVKPAVSTRNNTMKKNTILKMIRQHQEDRHRKQIENESTKPAADGPFDINTELKNAQLFFDHLAEKSKSANAPKNSTLKNYTQDRVHGMPDIPLNDMSSSVRPTAGPAIHINSNAVAGQPRYGCLKNGNLPTYRSYMNQTRKQPALVDHSTPIMTQPFDFNANASRGNPLNENISPSIKIGGTNAYIQPRINNISEMATNSIRQASYQQQLNAKLLQGDETVKSDKYRKRKRKKTIRRTYKTGKSKIMPKISVLVSNKTVRNNITAKTQLLKQTPIPEIKKYLIKHGLIRMGSTTPNDVLRKMYESAQTMCGEIHNHNPENLLYNFLNTSDEH